MADTKPANTEIELDPYDPDFWAPKSPEAEAFMHKLAMEKLMEIAPAVQKLFILNR